MTYEKNEKLVGQVTILFLYNRVKRGEFKNKEAGKPPGSCVRGDESVRYLICELKEAGISHPATVAL